MNVTVDLLRIVEQAHSRDRILEAATRVIAERPGVDGCFVFLLDEHGDPVRATVDGVGPSGRSQRADAEAESIAVQVIAESRVATTRGQTTSLLASPMLLRDRMVGALVLQSTARRAFSAEDIGTLAMVGAQLVGIIENARIIGALDRGERPVPQAAPRPAIVDGAGGRGADTPWRWRLARRRGRARRVSRRLPARSLGAGLARGRRCRGACPRANRDREDAQ